MYTDTLIAVLRTAIGDEVTIAKSTTGPTTKDTVTTTIAESTTTV